jgi:phosphoglycerate dehydrogenase-like enzyme
MPGKKIAYICGLGPNHIARVLALLPRDFEVVGVDGRLAEAEITQRASDSDFILVEACNLPETVINESKNLKFIHSFHQGFDMIPIEAARKRGIPVSNVGGTNAAVVAEHAVALILALSRRLPGMIETAKNISSKYNENRAEFYSTSHQLAGKRVGIVGLGNIGRKAARMLSGFDTDLVYYDAFDVPGELLQGLKITRLSLPELLKTSDIVTLHVPLMDSTNKLINRETLSLMKRSAILINTCRGPVVDEKALIQALQDGIISGAGLDVLEKEPTQPDNPLVSMNNVIVTPHTAGFVSEIFEDRVRLVMDNVLRVSRGEKPKNVVNKV